MAMSISPENEKLLSDIVASGQFKTQDEALAEALRLLKQGASGENGFSLPPGQWRNKFKDHLASTPATTATFIDDSRESIYEGRGE